VSDVAESVTNLVSQGIVVKKGKFTTSEEVAVRDALDWFREVSVPYFSILRPDWWVPGKRPLA